jgi:hypothetical protein
MKRDTLLLLALCFLFLVLPPLVLTQLRACSWHQQGVQTLTGELIQQLRSAIAKGD